MPLWVFGNCIYIIKHPEYMRKHDYNRHNVELRWITEKRITLYYRVTAIMGMILGLFMMVLFLYFYP